MDIAIEHEAFVGRGLKFQPSKFFRGPRIILDGREIEGKRGRFQLTDNAGNDVELVLRPTAFGIDPIPKVEIEGQVLELARPMAWYEYAWMALPILLLFVGGALGGLAGGLAVVMNARVFRSSRSTVAKYGISALVSLGAVLLYLVGATLLYALIGDPASSGGQ